MARYGKIDVRMWGDAKYLALSAPPPNAQTLWVYLLSGPHRTSIPGLFVAGEAMLAEALRWPLKGFREAFQEILAQGMLEIDAKSRVVWIPKAVIYNPPESPNVVRSWRSYWDEVTECELKDHAWTHLKGFLEAFGEGFTKAFEQACGERKASAKPSGKASIKPQSSHDSGDLGAPSPNQEQEPEQEPEPEQEGRGKAAPLPDLVSAWNALGKPFSHIRLTDPRVKHLKTRWSDAFWRENWEAALAELPRSKFLSGINERGWTADVDWFLKPDSVAKIIEGKYADNPNAHSKPGFQSHDDRVGDVMFGGSDHE